MDTVFVKPADGVRIRQPNRNNRIMPADGDTVPRNDFYTRLILSGDLVESDPPKVKESKRQPRGHHDTGPTPANYDNKAAQET